MTREDREKFGGAGRHYEGLDDPEGEREMAIVDEIVAERGRARNLAFGGDTEAFDRANSANDWVAYICAYAGRAAAKCPRNEREHQGFRENMVKVAALALSAIEAHDKGYVA